MTTTKEVDTKKDAHQLYQHVEKMFDVFWKQYHDDKTNLLAYDLQIICGLFAKDIKRSVEREIHFR